MSALISKFLGGTALPGLDSAGSAAARVLAIKPSLRNPELVLIQPAGSEQPLYSANPTRLTSPNVVMYYGPPESNYVVATADTGSMSSTNQFTVRGQQMSLKMSSSSGSYSVQTPMGQFKWKPSQMGGSSLGLVDANGTKLAKYKSGGIPGMQEKKLEVYVQCDDYLVEIMLISGMVAAQLAKAQEKVASEVIQALAGT